MTADFGISSQLCSDKNLPILSRSPRLINLFIYIFKERVWEKEREEKENFDFLIFLINQAQVT